jgi:hypothetical protein
MRSARSLLDGDVGAADEWEETATAASRTLRTARTPGDRFTTLPR